ncbi:MAG TPA: biopolymer transporter ExbD [Puia sp.]|nr:biopolymer transporter ExbD [Puia sp.]
MAELNASVVGHKKGSGVRKGKKLSTRVDLTPMVDLGFLLITFFIFTTTMSKPRTMTLNLPMDTPEDNRNLVPISGVITLMMGKNDQIYYYEGKDLAKLKTSNFKGIRNVILDKKRRTDAGKFNVILKPSPDASYRNTVDILDEMTIDGVRYFAMVDISPGEYVVVLATELANGINK